MRVTPRVARVGEEDEEIGDTRHEGMIDERAASLRDRTTITPRTGWSRRLFHTVSCISLSLVVFSFPELFSRGDVLLIYIPI